MTSRASTDSDGPGRRAGIEREQVVECALAMIEAGGAESLTMRKLAAELGVTTSTVYWHAGGRDEIVLAAVQLLSRRLAEVRITGATPRRRVMAAARVVWDSALAHPEVTGLAHRIGASSLLELPLEMAVARELEAAGLVGDEARDALRAVLACVGGLLVLALRDESAIPVERRSEALWATVEDPGIDPATVAAHTRPADLAALFETAVGAVVDRVVPAETRPPSPGRTP